MMKETYLLFAVQEKFPVWKLLGGKFSMEKLPVWETPSEKTPSGKIPSLENSLWLFEIDFFMRICGMKQWNNETIYSWKTFYRGWQYKNFLMRITALVNSKAFRATYIKEVKGKYIKKN